MIVLKGAWQGVIGRRKKTCNRLRREETSMGESRRYLIEEVLPVKSVPLRRTEAGVADHAAELFFRGAVRGSGCLDHVFFQHDGADVIASEPESHLANL